jgi:uncharacterized protein YjbI with pentapeptide repeats
MRYRVRMIIHSLGAHMKKFLFISVLLFSSPLLAQLRYDPSQLAQFETTGRCLACDLTNIKLKTSQNVQTPFNLEGANLSGSTFAISNSTLSDFNRVTAIQTHFSNGDYSQASFVNATLIQAIFIKANLSYTNFAGADVRGADFSGANLYGSQGINLKSAASVCNAILPDGSIGFCNLLTRRTNHSQTPFA